MSCPDRWVCHVRTEGASHHSHHEQVISRFCGDTINSERADSGNCSSLSSLANIQTCALLRSGWFYAIMASSKRTFTPRSPAIVRAEKKLASRLVPQSGHPAHSYGFGCFGNRRAWMSINPCMALSSMMRRRIRHRPTKHDNETGVHMFSLH